jgi:hypothetical protein
MAKELAKVDQADMDKLVGLGVTGHDIGAGNIYPSSVNILQSDKQYEAFEDGDSITKKMYGKLFIRRDSNKTTDLVDEIRGTMIKIERGYEIRDTENKIVESGYGFLNAIEKDEYGAQGLKPINMVKVLLATGDSKETKKAMDELNAKMASGKQVSNADYPFAVVVVKGSSFGNWFNVEKMMQDLANEHFLKPLNQIPVIAFQLIVTSNKEEGDGYTYYSMDFNVEPNDPAEALEFSPYLLEAKEQHLFYKVKEKVHDGLDVEDIEEPKQIEEPEVVDIDDEDLPF